MEKTIEISLGGRAERFRLEQDAYDRLARYLDRAGARLPHDADRAEVLGDLERAVADRLSAMPRRPGPGDRAGRSTASSRPSAG